MNDRGARTNAHPTTKQLKQKSAPYQLYLWYNNIAISIFFFLILFHFILFYPLLALFVDCHSQVFLYIWGWSASKEAFFLFYFHVRAAMD